MTSLGLTCREVAAKLGIPKSTVNYWLQKLPPVADPGGLSAADRRRRQIRSLTSSRGAARSDTIQRINRELRFKADSPGCRLLVDQLMDFPLAEHDDGPDALEMCTRLPLEVIECGYRITLHGGE